MSADAAGPQPHISGFKRRLVFWQQLRLPDQASLWPASQSTCFWSTRRPPECVRLLRAAELWPPLVQPRPRGLEGVEAAPAWGPGATWPGLHPSGSPAPPRVRGPAHSGCLRPRTAHPGLRPFCSLGPDRPQPPEPMWGNVVFPRVSACRPPAAGLCGPAPGIWQVLTKAQAGGASGGRGAGALVETACRLRHSNSTQ